MLIWNGDNTISWRILPQHTRCRYRPSTMTQSSKSCSTKREQLCTFRGTCISSRAQVFSSSGTWSQELPMELWVGEDSVAGVAVTVMRKSHSHLCFQGLLASNPIYTASTWWWGTAAHPASWPGGQAAAGSRWTDSPAHMRACRPTTFKP